MKLLYRTSEWHAFAKLRLHTESTLEHLEQVTEELGQLMREFEKSTKSRYSTVELPKEAEARGRRQGPTTATTTAQPSRKKRGLNLFTYKWHALGDYVRAIRLFGGTDGFSTQVVSLSS